MFKPCDTASVDTGALSSLIQLQDHIVIDGFTTWPKSVQCYLQTHESEINSYVTHERNIDRLSREDVFLRLRKYRPTNSHLGAWVKAKEFVKEAVADLRFVGFHCTRLTQPEIKDISDNGLLQQGKNLLNRKLDALQECGDMSPQTAEAIRELNDVDEPVRAGSIGFFHRLSGLTCGDMIHRLFRAWGGEAIYRQHETNPVVFEELTQVGAPCIVVASLNYSDIFSLMSVEERIIRIFLDRYDREPSLHDCDSFVGRTVPALEVIPKTEARFVMLTECDQWDDWI